MKKLPHVSALKLTRLPKPLDHADWVFELKRDGFRGIAYISEDECKLVSRNANTFRRFGRLSEPLGKLSGVRNASLYGEIGSLDSDGNSIFNKLLFRGGNPYFDAFDFLWLNGRDLRKLPLVEHNR